LFRPVSLLSFAAGAALGGPTPLAQHLINSLLHLACVALVYELGRRLTRHAGAALFAAAWFGLAPVLVETHVWISGRFDLMCTCLGLTALWLWQEALEAKGRASAAALQLSAACVYLGGMLAKEPLLCALPALLAWPHATRRSLGARVMTILPLCAAALVYLVWRGLVLRTTSNGDESIAWPLAAAQLPLLLLDGALNLVAPMAIFPRLLSEDYSAAGPLVRALAALLVLAFAAVLWHVRKRAPLAVFSALWFACTLAPVALISVRFWMGFGRYLYLPAALVLPTVAVALLQARERLPGNLRSPSALRYAALAYLALLALRSHAAVYAFASERALFEATIAEAPERAYGYGMLGTIESAAGRPRDAAPLLARAMTLAPDERRWASRYASALLWSGDVQGALRVAEHSMRRFERAPEFHLLAAYALLERDQRAAAAQVLECLLRDPQYSQAREALSFLRTGHRRSAQFRSEFDALLREPRYASLQ
jgi:4-amino-4-deoxy-L-arabinose transferase-like glycosyltransferase